MIVAENSLTSLKRRVRNVLTFSCYDILNAIANTEFFYIFLTESLLFFTEIILMQKTGQILKIACTCVSPSFKCLFTLKKNKIITWKTCYPRRKWIFIFLYFFSSRKKRPGFKIPNAFQRLSNSPGTAKKGWI